MSTEYKKDFVWMRRGAGKPEKVSTNQETLTQKMVAGYVQCAPPTETEAKEEK